MKSLRLVHTVPFVAYNMFQIHRFMNYCFDNSTKAQKNCIIQIAMCEPDNRQLKLSFADKSKYTRSCSDNKVLLPIALITVVVPHKFDMFFEKP